MKRLSIFALCLFLVSPALAGQYDAQLARIFAADTEMPSGTYQGLKVVRVALDEQLFSLFNKKYCPEPRGYAYLVYTQPTGNNWTYAGCASFTKDGLTTLPVFTN